MQSGSQSASSTAPNSSNRLSELFGLFVALLTLAFPITVIAYYSNVTDLSTPATPSRPLIQQQ